MTQDDRRFVDAYQAIGYVVVVAAQVERICSDIAIRVGVNPAKVYNLSATDVIKKIHARADDSDLAANVSEVLRTHGAVRLLNQRHNLVHGRLWPGHRPDGFTMSRIKRDGTGYIVAWPYEQFNKLVDRFDRLVAALLPYLPFVG